MFDAHRRKKAAAHVFGFFYLFFFFVCVLVCIGHLSDHVIPPAVQSGSQITDPRTSRSLVERSRCRNPTTRLVKSPRNKRTPADVCSLLPPGGEVQ